MKKIFIAILCTISIFGRVSYGQQNITQDKAWEIVQNSILNNNLQNINVFVSNAVITANSSLKTIYRDEESPTFNAWFFFIDDKPFANWTPSLARVCNSCPKHRQFQTATTIYQ